jgi:YesN/AraC family two-component response regulator
MTHQKPFLKNDLRLSDLADSIGVSSHELSQHINREFKMNFYDFINGYRVEEAKKLLRQNPANPKMLAVAFDVGFNSKATFNRVFKKLTGQTPSAFKDSPTA